MGTRMIHRSPQWNVRLVQVLHRHGDRSPLHNVFEGASDSRSALGEVGQWRKLLPSPQSLSELELIPILNENDEIKDSQGVFGQLSRKGIAQMTNVGRRLRERYGSMSTFRNGFSQSTVHAYSTNYMRTQQSVQCVLLELCKEEMPSNFPTVKVLPLREDILNTYSAHPEISRFQSELQDTDPEFRGIEAEKQQLKSHFIDTIPFLSEENFTWMKVADYIMCREAHSHMEFIPSTQPHATEVVHHLAYRFHKFYSEDRIIRLVSGKFLRHLMNEINQVVSGVENSETKLILYSGHDVSILGLMYALNINTKRFQTLQNPLRVDVPTYWPPYASTATIELLESCSNEWMVVVNVDEHRVLVERLEGFSELINHLVE